MNKICAKSFVFQFVDASGRFIGKHKLKGKWEHLKDNIFSMWNDILIEVSLRKKKYIQIFYCYIYCLILIIINTKAQPKMRRKYQWNTEINISIQLNTNLWELHWIRWWYAVVINKILPKTSSEAHRIRSIFFSFVIFRCFAEFQCNIFCNICGRYWLFERDTCKTLHVNRRESHLNWKTVTKRKLFEKNFFKLLLIHIDSLSNHILSFRT